MSMTPTDRINLGDYAPQINERERLVREICELLRLTAINHDDFVSAKARLQKTSIDVLQGILDTEVIQTAIAMQEARRRTGFGILAQIDAQELADGIQV